MGGQRRRCSGPARARALIGLALFHKGDAVDYLHRGDAKQSKGDPAGPPDYTKGIKLNPHDVACYHSRGDAKLDKKDLEGAIADFTKAIELKPDDAGSLPPARRCEARQKGPGGQPLRTTPKPSSSNPMMRRSYLNRSLAKKAKGDLDGASADHSKAIELNPDLAIY